MPYSSRSKYRHERIVSPTKCDRGSFRVKEIKPGVKVVVCCPKGQFRNGRCQVGTMAQKIMKRK